MKNNSKTLTIETKKLWIIGALLSLVASIYPTIWFADIVKKIWELYGFGGQFNISTFIVIWFPTIFAFFFTFTIIFILLCKWQSKKNR